LADVAAGTTEQIKLLDEKMNNIERLIGNINQNLKIFMEGTDEAYEFFHQRPGKEGKSK
jgi:hypothetical protein